MGKDRRPDVQTNNDTRGAFILDGNSSISGSKSHYKIVKWVIKDYAS